MPAEGMLLRIEDVEFSYEAVHTLNGVRFEARPGEFLGLIGPNGSGKTTLLRCINGLLKPQKGAIYLEGSQVSKMKLSEIAKVCAGVPTDIPDDFNISVEEYVYLGRYPHVENIWWEEREDEEQVEHAIECFELDPLRRRKLFEVSSGEKERVLLAKAVVQEPKVLLVDEPSAHLDLKFKLEVMERLHELSRRGITVIVASHDINLLIKYCDRVIIMKNGGIVKCGSPEEVMTPELIRDVYEVEAVVVREDGELVAVPKRPLREGEKRCAPGKG
ncbi:MAG TPA: ABC transporter ATP-binding protein [Methanomassiliicoccales archaeon]|nr:ABC transporter ATP-binding protein [Methanomassiliicoccales archaeon]